MTGAGRSRAAPPPAAPGDYTPHRDREAHALVGCARLRNPHDALIPSPEEVVRDQDQRETGDEREYYLVHVATSASSTMIS